jgi:effector-binding domain-containing protein
VTTIKVEIHEDTETLHTSVSRDCDDEYYEIPEHLVVAYEATWGAHEAAVAAIVGYIEANGLEPRSDDEE